MQQNRYLEHQTRWIVHKISFAAGFDNKLVSLQVGGGLNGTTNCCFGVYSEPEFRGDFLHFRFNPYNDGKYESASDMGKLFRAATSIQLLDETCTEPYDSWNFNSYCINLFHHRKSLYFMVYCKNFVISFSLSNLRYKRMIKISMIKSFTLNYR